MHSQFKKQLLLTAFTVGITLFGLPAQSEEAPLRAEFGPGAGVSLTVDAATKARLGFEAECGFVRDAAMYASFGVEAQIAHCSKVLFSLDGSHQLSDDGLLGGGLWRFKAEFAPLYEAIRHESKDNITYQTDADGNDIDGANHYRDWYKNLGSRIYDPGDVPLIETFLSYEKNSHLLKMGRMKGIVGFTDDEVFWGDDGKFAPMQHWLARDLFTGFSYTHSFAFGSRYQLESTGAIYSGNNAMKGYGSYLGGVQTPNLKANNSGTFTGNLRFHDRGLFGGQGFIHAGWQINRKASTWADDIEEGKRNNHIRTIGARYERDLNIAFISGFESLVQATTYISGLKTGSSQDDGHARFKDITQSGYFAAATVRALEDRLALSAGYEVFDRYDYNIYEANNFSDTTPYDNATQSSLILGATWSLSESITLAAFMHKVDNPAEHVSHVLDERGSDRIKFTVQIK